MASGSRSDVALEHQYDQLNLEEDEEGILITGDEEEEEILFDDRWCLVGMFLTGRTMDFDAMRHMMASLWQPGKGVFVKELDTNRYIFQFYHELDVQAVIDGSPWTFNRVPLVFHRLQQGEDPRSVRLHKLDMWVQIHDLRSGFMMDKVVRSAGAYVGTYVKSDPKNFSGIWRDYLRVRATIDIEKPLKRRMKLSKESGEWLWANFKYEHLPTFCFVCGIIGHAERLCPKRFEQTIAETAKPYGIGLRAVMKKKNYLIGAQWLRTGREEETAMEGGAIGQTSSGGQGVNASKIMEVDGEISGVNGSVRIPVIETPSINARISMESVQAGVENLNKETPYMHDSDCLLDTKKRRMEVIMGKRICVDDVADVEKVDDALAGSKNVKQVGLGFQAHQTL
ncbi:hypothetical protein CsatB_015053 [Cannabis sativa]